MRYLQMTTGKPKLVGWSFGPLKFGVAKRIVVQPIHTVRGRFGTVVFVLGDKPYSLASLEKMRFDLDQARTTEDGGES